MIAIHRSRFDAAIFDLDGIVTRTASVHEAAWAELFDDFLAHRPDRQGEDHRSFTGDDYTAAVDGKPRLDGVSGFLEARGISLPLGSPSDAEDADTAHGLAARKDRYFRERLDADGVDAYPSTVDLVRALQDAGIATAVFSASRNAGDVLEAAGLGALFPERVDGVVAAELGISGKPDPAMLLEAARRLGATPRRTVVFEDALAGVAAGRRGGFGLVVGVDRAGQRAQLEAHGADVVVDDLAAVEVVVDEPRRLSEVPSLEAAWGDVGTTLRARRGAVVFVDFDGTLSPIVDDPSAARLVEGAGAALERLRRVCPVAVVSGRDLADVQERVGIEGIWYAGSHGFELAGPGGEHHEYEPALRSLGPLDAAETELRRRLADVSGAVVERKRFGVSAHYRAVLPERVDEVRAAVDEIAVAADELRSSPGRQVAEVRPAIAWDKGRALGWLCRYLEPDPTHLRVYVGDDLTDEDALEAVHDEGLGIVVRSAEHGDRVTAAHVVVESPHEVCELLGRIADVLEEVPAR